MYLSRQFYIFWIFDRFYAKTYHSYALNCKKTMLHIFSSYSFFLLKYIILSRAVHDIYISYTYYLTYGSMLCTIAYTYKNNKYAKLCIIL